MWRRIKKVLIWITVSVLSLMFISAVLVYFLEDNIKSYAVERLNKQLNTRVDVEEIELSLWKRFPYASLTFKNVLVKDTYPQTKGRDTLFFSKRIFLDFNILDLWNEDYSVHQLAVQSGAFHIRISEDGATNYNVFKNTDKNSKGNFDFELEDVTIQKMRFTYNNQITGQNYNLLLKKGQLKGQFNQKKYALKTSLNADIKHIKNGPIPMLFHQNISGKVQLLVNKKDSTYDIQKADIQLSGIPLKFKGHFSPDKLKINLSGSNLNLANVTNKMKGQYNTDYTTYKGKGKVDFDLSVIRSDSTNQHPATKAHFSIANGYLRDPKTGLSVKKVNFSGRYHNHKAVSQTLTLNNVHFETLEGDFDGNLSIKNFKYPLITTEMKGRLDLATIHQFFNLSMFRQLKGTVKADLNAKVQFKNLANRPDQFRMNYAQGDFELQETVFQMQNDSRIWKNVNGSFILNNNDAAMRDVSLALGSSDLLLNGALRNFVPYLQNAGQLSITSNLESEKINVEDFYNQATAYSKSPSKQAKKLLPKDVRLDFSGSIDQLNFAQHNYKNLYGNAKLNNQKLVLSKMKFKNSDGQFSGNIVLNDQPLSHAKVSIQLNTEHLNIKKLFAEWNNFDQKAVTSKHIRGDLYASLSLSVPIQRSGDVIFKNLKGNLAVTVKNGALTNLPMMRSTAQFIKNNNLTRLALGNNINQVQSRLLNLKFATLENNININNQKITIPEMIISSNLLDVTLSADHSFNNKINYHFDFRFRDLKIQDNNTEFGKIEDDGTGIRLFFRMYGTTDNPQFKLDKQKRKKERREKFQQEKGNVKSMLKEEFDLYEDDTTVNAMRPQDKEKDVEFEYSGGSLNDSDKKEDSSTKKNNKSKANKFFEKLERDKKKKESEEDEVEIEIQ